MPDEIQIPVCVSGPIEELGPSICMDGAQYGVGGFVGLTRIKPRNETVEKLLPKFAGDGKIYSVCGYFVRAEMPGCDHISAYFVGPSDEFDQQIQAMIV